MSAQPHPLLVLQARAQARALLYAAEEFDLDEALHALWLYALNSCVVNEIGETAVRAVIRDAFKDVAEL